MEPLNYFDVLGVDPEVGTAEIKKAYRKLVFKYHPDHNKDKGARKYYLRITEAYKILADPVTRAEYVQGQRNTLTDTPWPILEDCWEMIFKKGFK